MSISGQPISIFDPIAQAHAAPSISINDLSALGDLTPEEQQLALKIASIPLDKMIAEACRREFKYFVKELWDVVEPGSPYIHGWHIDAICDHLQAAAEGRIKNLIVAIPPRHSKSTIVSVFFPAWLWLRWPGKRSLFVSFAARLSDRDSRKCRNLIESVKYQRLFGEIFQLAKDSVANLIPPSVLSNRRIVFESLASWKISPNSR